MDTTLKLANWTISLAFAWAVCLAATAEAQGNRHGDAGQSHRSATSEKGGDQVASRPKIMVVVPETLLGRPRVPDPAGETELIRRFVEANLCVLDASEVAVIRYSSEMGHIIKEADIKGMKELCKKYRCDLFVAGEAFSEQVNERPAHDVVPITARARIEVKAFNVRTGEILAANAAVAGATDEAPMIAGKTALQNAAVELAEYLIPRIQTAIQEGRVGEVPPSTPYLLYGIASGIGGFVLLSLIIVIAFQQRRAVPPHKIPVDPRLTGQATSLNSSSE